MSATAEVVVAQPDMLSACGALAVEAPSPEPAVFTIPPRALYPRPDLSVLEDYEKDTLTDRERIAVLASVIRKFDAAWERQLDDIEALREERTRLSTQITILNDRLALQRKVNFACAIGGVVRYSS